MSNNFTYSSEDYKHLAKLLANNDIKGLEQFNKNKGEDFTQCTKTWTMLEEMKEIEQFDTDNAWDKLHKRLDDDNLLVEKKTKVVQLKTIISIAASLVVLIGLGFMIQKFMGQSSFIVENNDTIEAKRIVLPDGSTVYLNKDATLKYDRDFNKQQREVKLNGEAFFEIERNVEKPFVVNVNKAQVTVLGTSFNVRPDANEQLEVVVRTGKVKVCNCQSSGEQIILTKGEKGILQGANISKKENENVNYLAWMNKKLSFKSTALQQVVKDINSSYHANIEIQDPEISSMLITTTFDSLTVNEILESLVLTLNISVKYEDKKVILVKP